MPAFTKPNVPYKHQVRHLDGFNFNDTNLKMNGLNILKQKRRGSYFLRLLLEKAPVWG